jgi:uroporphyrinogen-III synthase
LALRVLVTRPAEQAAPWVARLRAEGLDALSLPLIAIGAPQDPFPVEQAWAHIDTYDGVMFVSANAAHYFFRLRPQKLASIEIPEAFKPRAFATGPGTVAALRACGVAVDRIDAPDAKSGQFDSEALWEVIKADVQPGQRLLIVRGAQESGEGTSPVSNGEGRDWFAQQVQAEGGYVEFVVAYQRQAPVLGINAMALVQTAAQDGSVWLFSSSEAVANLQLACPGQGWSQARAVATHSRIAQAARDAGFATVLVSRPDLIDILASIESLA